MNQRIIPLLLLPILLVSCLDKTTPTAVLVPEIPEFKDHYEDLTLQAQAWANDAYLNKVVIPLGHQSWSLSASFSSSTKTNEELEILIEPSGEFEQRIFQYPLDDVIEQPILRKEWEIGSREALSELISKNIESIQNFSKLCGSLVLVRTRSLPEQPLVWMLNFNDCLLPLSNSQSYLDPINGIIINP